MQTHRTIRIGKIQFRFHVPTTSFSGRERSGGESNLNSKTKRVPQDEKIYKKKKNTYYFRSFIRLKHSSG